jgi:hypothetical protein
MKSDADRDLRARFDALKRHGAANTPTFEAVLNRPRVRPTHPERRVVVAIAVVAVLALSVTLMHPPWSVNQPETALPAWPKTTESLLVASAAAPALDWSQLPTEIFDRLPKLSEQEKR